MENINVQITGLTAALETMDPTVLGGALVAVMGILAATVACAVIRYLMTAIGYSKMYRKAGIEGWKAFIPFYNEFNNYKISWNGKFYFLYLALAAVSTILGNNTEILQSLICSAAGIGVITLVLKQNFKMAKLFGKGAGTGLALIFFPGITSLILGMGKARFQEEIN